MDETKKIRVLEQNTETYMLRQQTTFELREVDAAGLMYTDFDEYTVSGGVLHTNEKVFFLLETKAKDNLTWASSLFMIDSHKHVAGPRKAMFTGMIYFMEKYVSIEGADSQQDQGGEDDLMRSNVVEGSHDFRGYSIVMQP